MGDMNTKVGKHRERTESVICGEGTDERNVKSMRNVRAYRGPDVGSDHHLLITNIKLKLRQAKNSSKNTLTIEDLPLTKSNKWPKEKNLYSN